MNIKIYNNMQLCLVHHEGEVKSNISTLQNGRQLSSSYKVDNISLGDLSTLDSLIERIKSDCKIKIDELSLKLQSTKSSDYSEQYEADVLNLKCRIQTVAKRLSEADLEFEDESFKNRLHELGELKKQLGSFKNEYTDDARKRNGTIKYDIKKLESERDRKLQLLDLELMERIIRGEV